MINISGTLKTVIFGLFSVLLSFPATAGENMITGQAFYKERIVLPPNAVFEAVLEDVSRMDVKAPVLGRVTVEPAGQVPIAFNISYNSDEIKPGHRYNVRGRIMVDGKLMFITDTIHPVLTDNVQDDVSLSMKMIRRAPQKTQQTKKQPRSVAPFTDLPLHFLGLLPGANCHGQYQLDLLPNQTYFLRRKCFKEGKQELNPSDDIGRWHINPENRQLVLTGGDEAPLLFSIIDSNTIEKRALNGGTINSSLNYRLETSKTAKTLEPELLLQGMYQYMADAALFQECLTSIKLPVVFEADHAALEAAYLKSVVRPGETLKIHIEGAIVQRPVIDGQGLNSQLLVKRFIRILPGKSCQNP